MTNVYDTEQVFEKFDFSNFIKLPEKFLKNLSNSQNRMCKHKPKIYSANFGIFLATKMRLQNAPGTTLKIAQNSRISIIFVVKCEYGENS